jgi:hypothetical protein
MIMRRRSVRRSRGSIGKPQGVEKKASGVPPAAMETVVTPETLAALEGSIDKWERIAAGEIADQGCSSCPLCRVFLFARNTCFGCPVMERTGEGGCRRTPYTQFDHLDEDDSGWARTAGQIEAAQAEVDFLKSLLPADETAREMRGFGSAMPESITPCPIDSLRDQMS